MAAIYLIKPKPPGYAEKMREIKKSFYQNNPEALERLRLAGAKGRSIRWGA